MLALEWHPRQNNNITLSDVTSPKFDALKRESIQAAQYKSKHCYEQETKVEKSCKDSIKMME